MNTYKDIHTLFSFVLPYAYGLKGVFNEVLTTPILEIIIDESNSFPVDIEGIESSKLVVIKHDYRFEALEALKRLLEVSNFKELGDTQGICLMRKGPSPVRW